VDGNANYGSAPVGTGNAKASPILEIGVLSKAEQQASTADRSREVRAAVLVTLVSVAQCARGGETDLDQLAPARLPALLAVEVTRGRPKLPKDLRLLIVEFGAGESDVG
jgi:hypothetical protein